MRYSSQKKKKKEKEKKGYVIVVGLVSMTNRISH